MLRRVTQSEQHTETDKKRHTHKCVQIVRARPREREIREHRVREVVNAQRSTYSSDKNDAGKFAENIIMDRPHGHCDGMSHGSVGVFKPHVCLISAHL